MVGRQAAHRRLTGANFLERAPPAVGTAYGLRPTPVLADIPDQFDGTKFKLAAPDPNPKSGGVLRMGITNRVPHFDLHQSGTINNLGSMGCMFDNLIRRDPRDSGKTIIPDLAHSWDIAKDRKTYTFFLRKGVPFHDGAELTSDDVKATFDRIVKPPQGISIPRSILFRAVSEVTAPDKYTIQFKLSETTPAATSSCRRSPAAGTLSSARRRWRTTTTTCARSWPYPGTGPVQDGAPRRERNLGGREEQGLLEQGAAIPRRHRVLQPAAVLARTRLGILAGRVDYGRVTDPVTVKKAQATKGMNISQFNQSVIQATYTNTKKGPMADPRVRRAMHLALDRPTLIEAIKDVAPMQIGGFMYPFSDLATPKAELCSVSAIRKIPRRPKKEAKSLMAAAGYPNGIQGMDYLIRDLASYHVWSQAIQAMLQQTLNITCNLRYVVKSVWFDDIANGHFDLAIGAVVSTLLDPSDYFNAWYHTGGPQNYSAYSNAKVDALIGQIDREVDPAKRQALIRETEAIFEQDPPLLPVAWEKIDDIWYDYVKGLRPDDYFGAYDVCREDTFWMDKT